MNIFEKSLRECAEPLNDKGLFALRCIINIEMGVVETIPRNVSTLAYVLGVLDVKEDYLKRMPEAIKNIVEAVVVIEDRTVNEISVGLGSVANIIKFKYPKRSLDIAYDILRNYLRRNGYIILDKAA